MLVILDLRHFSPALIASPRPIWTLANLCKTYFDIDIHHEITFLVMRITFIQKVSLYHNVNFSHYIGMDLSNGIFKC